MPGRMAPLKKPRHTAKLPLALNPMKSKDVLAVLAERNQAVVPVGAWVEPASSHCWEISAHTSACMIEEELKEQQRRKQESLRCFQRQVKLRVNQQVKLRKKQQLQKSYKAAEKESSLVMQCSESAHLTPKRTSVFPHNLNTAIGSSWLPSSQMLDNAIEGGENQNELFQQQAQALSQTMKQARHQLASFKTVSEKKASVLVNGGRKSSPTQESSLSGKSAFIEINRETREEFPLKDHEVPLTTVLYQNFMENEDLGYEEISPIKTDEKERDFFVRCQQDLLCEDNEKSLGRVQKVKFKNPLFVVIKEDKQKELNLQSLQDALPEAQVDVIKVQSVEPEAMGTEPETPSVEPENQASELEAHTTEPEGQVSKIETQDVLLRDQTIRLEEGAELESQDCLPEDYYVLPKYWNVLPKYQDQNFLPISQGFLPRNKLVLFKDQKIILKCQDQAFLPKDQNFLSRDQFVLPTCQKQDFLPEDFLTGYQHVISRDQLIMLKYQEQDFLPKDQNYLHKCQEQNLPSSNQYRNCGQASCDMTDERWKKEIYPGYHVYGSREIQDPGSTREQSLYLRQQPSVRTGQRRREDLRPNGCRYLPPRYQKDTCSRRQVSNGCVSELSTEFQAPLSFQSGVDQEEDRKERQKQYLRHRRLFMDIEREQVKEQKRQKEQKKKIEKIKKKKEQLRYAEEQRILRMNSHEDPLSAEKMSNILAQLQLEKVNRTREKQRQREKEHTRYVEALRAQVQEKMKLYNITLPPLCCCGPDFWDAHPDTCANNCIFYKNYKAYNRALHSVINSSDISEGNSTLRNAIRNFASAHSGLQRKSLSGNSW